MKKFKQKLFGNGNKGGNPGGPRNLVLAVLFFVLCLALLTKLGDLTKGVTQIPYSKFIEQVEQNKVKSVRVDGAEISGEFKDGAHFVTVIVETPTNWELLKKHNVEINVEEPANSMSFWYIMFLVMLLTTVVPGLIWYFTQKSKNGSGGGAGGIFSMGKSRAKLFMPSTIKDNFNSVAGAQEAKEELYDVVDFLRYPAKYQRLGAKISRGVLLIGEPGNGKTLLARAVAGEANCPFFSISGSDFIEVFVGVGAARVRDLFEQARKKAPCIIFIDEIDAVGRHRGSGMGGGHDEREQTLNQLLTEMDGFETTKDPVIVIAATNRPDVLDKALLRPGRFDRRVEVPYPDLKSREQILKLHAAKVKMSPEVDLQKIARGTPGFSGADLANLINEAALIASKTDQTDINLNDLEEARDKVTLGKENKSIILTENDRKITAVHEAGHALVALLLPEVSDPLHKVTIIPRGRALGVTHSLPVGEKHNATKQEFLAKVAMCLGGRVAEQIVFNDLTTGAYSDFRTATEIVRNMVCLYGMSEKLGNVIYGRRNHGEFEFSEKTAELIDAEVLVIMDQCLAHANQLITANRDKLDLLSQALLEKETLYAAEIYELLGITPREDLRFNI